MNSVTLWRRIVARPSIVFDALTTAEGIAAWWGPDELPVVRADVDARVGGTFVEITAPRRIVMTYLYTFGGEPDEFGRTSRVEIDLVPFAGGTDLTLTHSDLTNETSKTSHAGGWGGALDKLVRFMELPGVSADLNSED